MSRFGILFVLCGLVLFPARGWGAFVVELKTGAPINMNMNMYYWTEWDANVTTWDARWRTDPFKEAPYYVIRFGLSDENQNKWELELIHHKVILNNPPPQFTKFNISHGYNFLMINRAWKTKYFTWRVGGGIILAHPEAIRADGKTIPYDEGTLVGFYTAGIGVQVAIERRWYPIKKFFVSPEVKLTFAQAQVEVAEGWVNVPNIAMHFTVGLGYEL